MRGTSQRIVSTQGPDISISTRPFKLSLVTGMYLIVACLGLKRYEDK